MATSPHLPTSLLLLCLLFISLSVSLPPHHAAAGAASKTNSSSSTSANPFTVKAAVIRYWNRKIPNNNLPHPSFLLSKLSPLSAIDSATYSSLAATDPTSLSSRLQSLCTAARLLCSPILTPSLSSHHGDSAFASYIDINFTNYATSGSGPTNSFKNYSDSENIPMDTFRQYARNAAGAQESFAFYEPDGNVITSNFTSYSSGGTGGSGVFTSYGRSSNVPDLKFTNYATDGNGPVQTFTSYSDDSNSGEQSFSGYGKRGNGVPTTFTSYSNNSNVIASGFSGYGEDANGASDTFASYGFNGNVPELTFKAYGENGNAGVDTFNSYRDQANVGDSTFTSYEKGANDGTAVFNNYGNSANVGSDTFKGYGEGSGNDNVTFTSYAGDNTTFKAYAKTETAVTFKTYENSSSSPSSSTSTTVRHSEKMPANKVVPNNRWVEPGKFFRESNLRKGSEMMMPDIRDKMPVRSFLPRSISSRIPFSATAVEGIFKIPADSAMGKAVADTVAECERAPSRGETKRCVASAEDMIDFASSVLGNNAVVRSTENTKGSKGSILIGLVKGVNGGKLTKSVSCHQSLFPYLVYYCHAVPEVRVYEAEILSVETKDKINRGIAICHIDTSDWSAGHGAFVALGSGPGKIEVCHWIFEGDMTWAVADD